LRSLGQLSIALAVVVCATTPARADHLAWNDDEWPRVRTAELVAAGVMAVGVVSGEPLIAPDARIAVGHGQMPAGELEKVMLRFLRREVDILVCTTIIESGLDIPTANTMFINQADHFGLSDLHQLRGRVGRYKHRAYCYLILPSDRPITDTAARRLKAIEQFSMLGAGFKIAMRDLEIRGAGNLLGKEQSGHIAAVGYEMYCRLLDQKAKKLKQQEAVRRDLISQLWSRAEITDVDQQQKPPDR